MRTTTVSMRELRIQSSAVLRAVDAGGSVVLTVNGEERAEIVPSRSSWIRLLDEIEAQLPLGDSGAESLYRDLDQAGLEADELRSLR